MSMPSRADVIETASPRRQRACGQKGSVKGERTGKGNKICEQNEFEDAAETHIARARVGAPVAEAGDEVRVGARQRVPLAVRADEAERVVDRALHATKQQTVVSRVTL